MGIVVHSKKSLFQQKFQKNGTILTGIPNLGVWCKKLSDCSSGVGGGHENPTPTPSIVRNPTPAPPKKNDSLQLRLRNPG